MTFKCDSSLEGNIASFTLAGELDAVNAPTLSEALKGIMDQPIEKIVFYAQELEYISSAGLRVLVFAKQKMGIDTRVYIISPQSDVVDVIKMSGFDSFLTIQDSF